MFHPHRSRNASVDDCIGTAAALCIASSGALSNSPAIVWSALVLLRLGSILFASNLPIGLVCLGSVVALPLLSGYDQLVTAYLSPYKHWSNVDWVMAALGYSVIPIGTYFVDVLSRPVRSWRAVLVRLGIEVTLVLPLWLSVGGAILIGAVYIP